MGSAPSPPPVPNPVTTASAQAEANAGTASAQTALNNVNQVTPYGSETFNATGTSSFTNPDGTVSTVPTYTETQTLSPQQQNLYNQQVGISSQMNQAASGLLSNAKSEISDPVTMSSLPMMHDGFQSGSPIQQSYDNGGQVQTGYDAGGTIQNSYASGGAIQSSVPVSQAATTFGNTASSIQGDVDTAGIEQATNDATNAALARLQPSMDQSNNALESQLANQGVSSGSDAYMTAMLGQAQSNNDLRLGAVQTGDQEQQAAYNQALESGTFHNAAQQQDYDQQQGRGMFALQSTEANNAANLSAGQFANQAQAQANGQNAEAAMFNNSAQAQQNSENAQAAAFSNAGQAQINEENAQQAQFYNSAQTQQFGENQDKATFANQAREQYLTDSTTINNQAINQASVLEHGGQVTAGQYSGYTPGQIGTTPISQDTYASANMAEQQYQTQAQIDAQNNSAMFGAFGGLLKLGMGGL